MSLIPRGSRLGPICYGGSWLVKEGPLPEDNFGFMQGDHLAFHNLQSLPGVSSHFFLHEQTLGFPKKIVIQNHDCYHLVSVNFHLSVPLQDHLALSAIRLYASTHYPHLRLICSLLALLDPTHHSGSSCKVDTNILLGSNDQTIQLAIRETSFKSAHSYFFIQMPSDLPLF